MGGGKLQRLLPLFGLQFLGCFGVLDTPQNGEVLSVAKKRATHGANILDVIAQNTGSVLLAGHGFMNRYIAKELLLSGWEGPLNPGMKYWEFGVYEKKAILNGSKELS